MPRKTRKALLAQRQDPAAPYLFDQDQLPVRADVLQAVRTERYKHTGQRLLECEEDALRLVELLLARWGVKRIAKEMRISKWTVIAARDALVKRGELAPYKERMVTIYEQIVEQGALNYLSAIENNRVAPAQIPFGVGIFSDKRALLVGEPTSIGATAAPTAQDREDLSVDRLNAWWDNLKPAKVAPADVASTEKPTEPAQIAAPPAADARKDATPDV